MEQTLNRQNDRVYAFDRGSIPPHLLRVTRAHHPVQTMVFLGVSVKGCTKMIFVEQGAKVRAQNYIKDILEKHILVLKRETLGDADWVFQQDSAPAHKAKVTQKWLKDHVPDFIAHDEWPPASPDLNPLDYFVWSKLESMVNATSHKSLEGLKEA